MVGLGGGLMFMGTDAREPTGRDESIVNGTASDIVDFDDSDADEDSENEDSHAGEASRKRQASSAADGGEESTKKARVTGGRAPVAKRVVADYDSDDGRIIELKQQGYSDEWVAARLIEENRIRYVPKTVGSRWLRLRKALEAAEDERLDDELSDWHVGEDELLHESIKLIDEKLEVEFEKLKERKWREVSINFAARLEKEMKIYGKKYTAKACKERMEGLQDGTASLPIELDPDQEGRKKTSEARIAAAKKARRERVAEQQRAEDEKTTRLEKKKVDDAEKERKRIAETHERAAEKAAEARMKKDRKQAVTDQKAKKQAVLAQIKAQEEWLKTKARVEREILARLSGKPPPRVRHSRRRRSGRDSTAEGDEDDGDQADGSDNDDDEPAVDFEEDEEQGQLGDISDYLANTVASPASGPASAVDAPKAAGKAEVTKETLLNPRSILTDSELDVLLFERKLARRSVRETHPEVVARLAAADEAISAPELVDRLRTDFLKTNGNREAKIRRLRESDAGKSAAGAAGVTATDLEFRKGYEGYSGVHSSLLGDE